jgi:putative Mg2+ transporter-C (MgtC) family protein
MTAQLTTEFILRLFAAAIMGGVIGMERGYRAKEAGFRTHFLVALGSAIFMILSQYGFESLLTQTRASGLNVRLDPSRIAAQVVSGIGFIGAGTIIFQKHVVRGLTTAAGLWVTSAIGMTCGAGLYTLAIASTVMVLICLEILNLFMKKFGMRNVSVTFSTDSINDVRQALDKMRSDGIAIDSYNLREMVEGTSSNYVVSLELNVKRNKYESLVFSMMEELDGVKIESIE